MLVDRALQEGLQASRKSTFRYSEVVGHLLGEESADRVRMGMLKVDHKKQVALVVEVEGRSYDVVTVEGTKEEACLDHLLKRHSDVWNDLVHPSKALLEHSFVEEYSMEALKVFVDVRYMQAWHLEDGRM
jgi:hypothetical protein